jgi:DNA-binding transcriptional LysR family regulator
VILYTIEGLVDSIVSLSIAKFSSQYPEIHFQVDVASTDRIIEAIVAGQADIGIALNAPRRPDVSVCFGWQEPLHAIVAPSHALSDRKSISLQDLAGYPATLPDRTFGVRRQIDTMLEKTVLQPKMLVITNSILTTICVARRGAAYTLMPMFAVERDIKAGTLLAIPLTDDDLDPSSVEICIHRKRRLPLAAREFLSWLENNIPKGGSRRPLERPRINAQPDPDREYGRRRAP